MKRYVTWKAIRDGAAVALLALAGWLANGDLGAFGDAVGLSDGDVLRVAAYASGALVIWRTVRLLPPFNGFKVPSDN